LIRGLSHFVAALRMHNYLDAWVSSTDFLDVPRLEALMDGAVALPQNDPRFSSRFWRITTEILIRIPHDHFVERDTHAKRGVPSEVFVRQKEDSLSVLEGPAHYRGGIRTGADGAAVLAGKRLDGRCGIHVGDGNELKVADGVKLLPADFHLSYVGHVCHRAAGVQVGKNHGLVRSTEDVRAFGHEMHTAKNDVARIGLRGLKGELQG